MDALKHIRFTLTLTFIGMCWLLIALLGHFDLLDILHKLEGYEADEYLLPVLLILIGVIIDLSQAQQRQNYELREQRLKVLQATMRTVQDVVNNNLNQLQLLDIKAGNTLDQESRARLKNIIQDTAMHIQALGMLDEVEEIELAGGNTGIKYQVAEDEVTVEVRKE